LVALYVVSTEGTGKTAICAGLGKHLLGAGKKVGFLKTITDGGNNSDAAFMKQVLDLPETVESLCPLISDVNKLKAACDRVAQGKDVVIIEGILSNASYEIAQALKSRVIIVQDYSNQLSQSAGSYKEFGDNLLGIVLNKVPTSQLKRVHAEISAQLGKAGVSVLGVLPEDRVLAAFTIGELAEYLQGEILNCAEKSTELVENVMLGAMCVDSGLDYFGRKANKVAVIRDNRPDMQMAALETSTRCLVISGGAVSPIYSVMEKAEIKGIPTISTANDTNTIVASIEDALSKTRFNQPQKLSKLTEIMQQHFDFQAIHKGLGLAG